MSPRRFLATVSLVVVLPTVVLTQEAAPVDALIGLARLKRDAGDLPAAIKYFEDAQRFRSLDDTETAEYLWCLADVDRTQARDVARRLLEHRPADANVRARAIALSTEAGDEAAVIRLATTGAQHDPATARWPRHLGESYMRQERPTNAVDAFARAVAQRDAVALDWASYAVALEAAARPSDALDAWAHVSAADVSARDDWARSRLRALGAAGPPAEAADAIEAWLVSHPDHTDLRGLLVEMWATAGRPDLALEAIGPLTAAGPAAARWLLREGELAHGSGDRARAIRAFDRLRRMQRATPAVLWTLAELLIQSEAFDQAAAVIDGVSETAPCDDRALALTDRTPDPEGTERLFERLNRRPVGCPAGTSWLGRAATRAMALGRHDAALVLVERYVEAGHADLEVRRLLGRLLMWTGHPARAADVLESVVSDDGSPAVVDAIIDAYRATGRPARAWTLATARLEDPSLTSQRRFDLAELAIEADQPERALDLALALEPEHPGGARGLAGRALLALGRPADAQATLRARSAVAHSPTSTLAFAEAVATMEGPERALAVVRGTPIAEPAWIEVLARRALWEATAGDREVAQSLITRTATLDGRRAALLKAEIALVDEQPAVAVATLRNLIETDADGRATDLYATALAGTGDLEGAERVLATLRARRPRFVPFALRQAEWRWQAKRSPDRLSAVLELARTHEARADAAVSAARVLIDEARFEDALRVLGNRRETWQRQPVDGRLIAARALRELGREHEALELVASRPIVTGPAAMLRAELTAAVDGPAAADALFADLAALPRSGPAVYLAWSAVQVSPAAQRVVLERAVSRFPRNLEILAARAHAHGNLGEWASALTDADRAISLDSRRADMWIVKVDATRQTQPEDLGGTLDRFYDVFRDDSALIIGMAERLAGDARSPSDPLIVRALAWLDGLPAHDRASLPARLAHSRVLAASERWDQALDIIDLSVAAFPDSFPARRLRADLLAFSGRHDEALAAYDAYLDAAPGDIEAARLRARTSGWAGKFAVSRRHYQALVAAHPDAAALAAEAQAKEASYEARWADAAEAYQRWLALEPQNREAAFELAQARLSLGDVRLAEALLQDLNSVPPVHRFADAAADRVHRLRRPSVEGYTWQRTSDGYDGLRLLELSERGGSVTTRVGRDVRTELGVSGGVIRARAAGEERLGHRAAVFGHYRVSPSWTVETKGGGLFFDGHGAPEVEGHGLVRWRRDQRWTVFAGAERLSVLENLATVDAGLQGTGGLAGVSFGTRKSSLDVTVSRHSLSDGNRRSNVTIAASRPLTSGRHQLRLLGWGWYTAFDEPRVDYFSPRSFARVDAGMEWSWWLWQPRFHGDRDRRLSASYLLGTDSNGILYHHQTLRLVFELPAGLAVETGASWIRSEVYRETEAHVGVRIGAPRRAAR